MVFRVRKTGGSLMVSKSTESFALQSLSDSDGGITDDKVSTVPQSKILSLDGGGSDSAAYILLYRSKTV